MRAAPFAAVLLRLALLARPGSAQDSALAARLNCAPASGPGRVFCQLDLVAERGRVVWGDALVIDAPEFVRPLRSRVAAHPDANGAPALVAKLALIASAPGSGSLTLNARAVVCRELGDQESCAPERVRLVATVRVAPAEPAGN